MKTRRLPTAALIAWLAFQPLIAAAQTGTPPSGSAWLSALRAASPGHRMDIAYDLQAFASDPQELHAAVAALSQAVNDPEPHVRGYVADALGELAAEPQIAIPALVRMLHDPVQEVSLHAALALRKFGPNALPALRDVLRERADAPPPTAVMEGLRCVDFDLVTGAAVYVLRQLGDDGVPVLASFLDRAHGNVLDYAVFGLRAIGSAKAADAVGAAIERAPPDIARRLMIGFPGERSTEKLIQIMVGPRSADIGFDAAKALADQEADVFRRPGFGFDSSVAAVRYGASIALTRNDPAPASTAVLAAALHDPDARVRASVAGRILYRANDRGAAVTALESAAADDPDPRVRAEALSSLRSVFKGRDDALRASVTAWMAGPYAQAHPEDPLTIETREQPPPRAVATPVSTRSSPPRSQGTASAEIVRALNDRDPEVRAKAFRRLMGLEYAGAAAAARAAFRDPDARVRIAAVNWLTSVPDAVATSMRSELESVLQNDRDVRVRYAAAQVLTERKMFSAAATATLAAQLADPRDDSPSALRAALKAFGADALPLLQTALRGPETPGTPEVLLALKSLRARASEAAPEVESLIIRGHVVANRIAAAEMLPLIAPQDAGAARDAEYAAASGDDVDLRMSAIAAFLALGGDPARLGSAYTAYAVEYIITPRLLAARDVANRDFSRGAANRCEGPPGSGRRPSKVYPSFPWPPPRFSSVLPLPRAFLGTERATLDDVANHLLDAIHRAGYEHVDSPFRSIPGGFVLVTPVEQADGQWRPAPPNYRFSPNVEPPQNALDMCAALFINPPGHFRMIVIAVTPDSYVTGGPQLKNIVLSSMSENGASGLPEQLGSLPLSNRNGFAIVYQFEKKLGVTKLDPDPALPGAEAHLTSTGILAKLKPFR